MTCFNHFHWFDCFAVEQAMPAIRVIIVKQSNKFVLREINKRVCTYCQSTMNFFVLEETKIKFSPKLIGLIY